MATIDERIEALKNNPEFIRKTKHHTVNLEAYLLCRNWAKEDIDFDSKLVGNLMGLVDPEIFQEALDDIGE